MWYQLNDMSLGEIRYGDYSEPLANWKFGRVFTMDKKRPSDGMPWRVELLLNGDPVGHMWWERSNGMNLSIKKSNGEIQERTVQHFAHGVEILSKIRSVDDDFEEFAEFDRKDFERVYQSWGTDIYIGNEMLGDTAQGSNASVMVYLPVTSEFRNKYEIIALDDGDMAFNCGGFAGVWDLLEDAQWEYRFNNDGTEGYVIYHIPDDSVMRSVRSLATSIYRNIINSNGEYRHFCAERIFKCCEMELYTRFMLQKPTDMDFLQCQIDHIVPMKYALNTEEVIILSHYSNLECVPTGENKRKTGALLEEFLMPEDIDPAVRAIYDQAVADEKQKQKEQQTA